MTSAELDEYESFIVPLEMMERLEKIRGRMTAEEVRQYILAATGDQALAEAEWSRQTHMKMNEERT